MQEAIQNESLTLEKESQLFFHTYSRLPLHVSHGEGVYLYSSDGRKFLDMVSGIGVNAVGYGNERLIKAIEDQARKSSHASNLFMLDPQFKLAEKLLKETGLSKVFFANSGTEAIEGAIKLSRKWASKESANKRQVLALTNSFHGRTYGAVSLTAKAKYHEGFEPLLPETGFITFNDLDDLEAKVSDKTAAVFLEFVQGEGGIFSVSEAFVRKLDELRKKQNFLVVADEIQAGCGRTGKFFSYMYYDFVPDVVCSAKPLGGGLPLAAIIGNERVENAFEKGLHGTTFGGNPVACAAGIAMLEEIEEHHLMENAVKVGAFIKAEVEKLKEKYPQILGIRQHGLMIGITVNKEATFYSQQAFEKGVIVNATSHDVIRLLPPLTITEKEAKICIDVLAEVFASEEKQ
ncbi:MAG: aspartate aminotransferase family protein [Chlorobiales bacterium]|nr:aspartate aminotransferase family protein [Chlorobiales bacterium]